MGSIKGASLILPSAKERGKKMEKRPEEVLRKCKNRLKRSIIWACSLILAVGMLAGCGNQSSSTAAPDTGNAGTEADGAEEGDKESEAPKEDAGSDDESTEAPAEEAGNTDVTDVPEIEGYDLLWSDEFNGTELNFDNWDYDPHEPGWTNAELQEYTRSTDNVYVENGNLVLRALKTKDDNGKDYYTSGKIKGFNKKDFMYGKVVARAKVPVGQGLWPAIWMMPTNEGLYGNWPKCGEIDIMEVLGSQPEIAYGTIHYGAPHAEQQGTYKLEGETFADDFHEYSVEWEPGEMRFYIDGNLYHTVNDWFTADEGYDDKPYPAPFNQTFYVQINLAVGGTWPGNPDSYTDFENAKFLVDYVRVYQKPEYDTNVEKPPVIFREPDENGNLVYNGDFSDNEALDDEELWSFLLFEKGAGTAEISDGVLSISPTEAGEVEYSVQIVQPGLPMKRGSKYHLSFEARADEERAAVVCISAPTAGWGRYLPDTRIEFKEDWQTYEFDFEMKDRDDNNGRLEFNMGNKYPLAKMQFRNVRLEEVE